jgi:phage shock protein E
MRTARLISTLGLCSTLGLGAAAMNAFAAPAGASATDGDALANPAIDVAGYLRAAADAAQHRAPRRLTEDEFVRMSRLPGTVILDARSRAKYDELHIRGAVYLSFPDITVESLARALPDRDAPILIYCNNNFANAPEPFPTKLPMAALNLATYVALYTYGYRNVYELGPLLDARTTRIAFARSHGAEAAPRPPAPEGRAARPR